MVVTMKRKVFDSFDPTELAWACVEPTLQQVHGMSAAVKSQAVGQLSHGQRALFLFRVLYDHAGTSAGDLYCWVSYLLGELQTWSAIKAGSRYFGDDAMLQLLQELESVLGARRQQGDGGQCDALPWDLDDDAELFASMSSFSDRFNEIVPRTLELMGVYIRDHPGEFVLIED